MPDGICVSCHVVQKGLVMDKQKQLKELMDVDFDSFKRANERNKEIGRFFVQGMNYRQIAKIYGLSPSRISQITDKLARYAVFQKLRGADTEFHELVEEYKGKIIRGETLIFHSDMEDMSRHLSASGEARDLLMKQGKL